MLCYQRMPTFRVEFAFMKNLILLHGALGSSGQMHPFAAELETHYRIHVLEFEGHGKTAASDAPLSIESLADQLNQYIQKNKLESSYVFGYSMGGYVALYHNMIHPHGIQKVACLATKFDWDPQTAQKEAMLLSPQRILEKFPGFAQLLQQRHGSHWEHVLGKTARMMLGLGKFPLLTQISLPTIHTPTLLLLGDKDHMVSKEETIRTAELLKNARFEILENTFQHIEKMNPVLLKSSLIQFFN